MKSFKDHDEEEPQLDEAKGLEGALRKLIPGYGKRMALDRNAAHWEVVHQMSVTKKEPEDKVRAKSLRHFKAAQKYSNILTQRSLPENVEMKKNKWGLILSDADKHQWGEELIALVNNAYMHTSLGSFVKDMYAVKGSEWVAMDWDKDPNLDCTIFFRKNRANETWTGFKVQGIGHDGSPESKEKIMTRLVTHLKKPGYWIESSDALARALAKRGAEPVTDEALCQAIFPGSNLKMLDKSTGLYQREVNGHTVKEIIYGKPKPVAKLSKESTEHMKSFIERLQEKTKEPTGDLKKACWKGYTAVGTKEKNGRTVPNCVPTNEEVEQIDESNEENAKAKVREIHSQILKKGYKYIGSEQHSVGKDDSLVSHNYLSKDSSHIHHMQYSPYTMTGKGGPHIMHKKTKFNAKLHDHLTEQCFNYFGDAEQIDELSKNTLASYNRKAWDDRQANQHKTAELSKKSLLYRGKTYTKDERDDAEKTHRELQKLAHRHGTRTKGIETSEKKAMAKEEVEQIDEISKDMATRYMKQIERQPGLDNDHPDKRKPSRFGSQKTGYERAFNKVSPYGRRVKVKATESVEHLDEAPAWQRKEGKNPEGGLNQKGVDSYRAENPGSKLQTAVTTEPSKLKKGSKSAKRRLSFCRRMKGMKDKLTSAETARDPDSRINKSLRKWNC